MTDLGKGVTGAVTIGTYHGGKVAVKRFFREEDDVISEDFVREICIMKKINNPYIMHLIEVSISEEGVCEIMMPLGKTDLFRLVDEGFEFDIKAMGEKIALGLIHLENNNVFHGDIKPENIIVMEDFTPKIADFGLSVVNACTFDTIWQDVNSIQYKSPEMFVSLTQRFTAYPWVFGLLMYFMSEMVHLFPYKSNERHLQDILSKIGGSDHWSPEAEERFLLNKVPREILFSPRKFPELVEDSLLNDLMNKVVVANPLDRISIFDVLRHPYFARSDVPSPLTCEERLDGNSIEVTIPDDYDQFVEIINANQLIPQDEVFSGIFATTMQLFCRFRRGDVTLIDLAIPLIYLAADINTVSHQDISADWFDVDMEDVDEDLYVDLYQISEDIIRIQKDVIETLGYDLWFTTVADRLR